jgi:hypothetical protein
MCLRLAQLLLQGQQGRVREHHWRQQAQLMQQVCPLRCPDAQLQLNCFSCALCVLSTLPMLTVFQLLLCL